MGESGSISVAVLDNDTDVDLGDTLSVIGGVKYTPGGTGDIVGDQITFDTLGDFEYLGAGESVDVLIGYVMEDNHGASDNALVTITVLGENDGPTANDDTATVNEDDLVATAINLTGDPRRWPNDYASSGVVRFNGPFLYRSTFHSENEQQETQRALEHLDRLIQMEGPDSFAAIILESVPGTAGIMVPPPGYLAGVREICDRYGIVFIADEVMAGFGRTGKWFAIDNFDVVPDLITFAKGVTSGYIPLGGVAINEAIYSTFADRAYPGGLTYSGHPLATACAVATITAMEDEGMVDNAARIGKDVLGPGLRELAARHRSVGEVRGLGVFWAIELVADQKTREPLAPYGGSSPALAAVLAACKSGGLLPFANFNRIHAVPPCNVSDDEVAEGLRILDAALSVADEHAV